LGSIPNAAVYAWPNVERIRTVGLRNPMKDGQAFLHFQRSGTVLVLSRKVEERIRIGDEITIVVTRISKDKVRLGVDAPKHMQVHREEVYEALKAAEAATDSDCD
jgi:carbon storage regulator